MLLVIKMNCENYKYPTLCKGVVIGSIISVVTAGLCYYYRSSPSNKETKPPTEETTEVNM
jgi:hypothetical protein